jgi:hypothetical protein
MKYATALLAISMATGLFYALPAHGSAEVIGKWSQVTASDLKGGSLSLRNPQTLDIIATGDFNGDGKQDDARLVKGDTQFAVIATVTTTDGHDSSVLLKGPLSDLKNVGVLTISKGDALETLSRNYKSASSAEQDIRTAPSDRLLAVVTYESSALVFPWADSKFVPVRIME